MISRAVSKPVSFATLSEATAISTSGCTAWPSRLHGRRFVENRKSLSQKGCDFGF